MGEREYASNQLLAFLVQIGPVEAQWAMQKALAALQDLPASEDHIEAVHKALANATVDEAGNASFVGEDMPDPPASTASRGAKGKAPA
jgi:hypothetical protein